MDAVDSTTTLSIGPIETSDRLRDRAYQAIKAAIASMDIYGRDTDLRLDERRLSEQLGVSRTPVREALSILEQEGFVRSFPRRGIFVQRKTKGEIIETITAWAALESMAARFAAERASDADLQKLRELFLSFDGESPSDHVDEYSEANIRFHQSIIRLGECRLIEDLTANLFVHVRAIRAVSIGQANRAEKSLQDHHLIIAALEARNPERAERLVRDHALGLAAHVASHGALD